MYECNILKVLGSRSKEKIRYKTETNKNFRRPLNCYFENTSPQRQCVKWFDWPHVAYGDIHNYLILVPSYYTHEQLKVYKSLDGYNSFANGWVSIVHASKAKENSRHAIFCLLAL